MTITLYQDPFYTNFDKAIDSYFGNYGKQASKKYSPSMDVYENENSLVVHVSLPGVNKEDIKLDVSDGMFSISAEMKKNDKYKDHNCLTQESFFGKFSRSFSLPRSIDTDKVNAKYNDGILEVEMMKKENNGKRTIKIA